MNSTSVTFVFVTPGGKKFPVTAPVGQSLFQIAHNNNIPLKCACEGNLCCATCHVVLDKEMFATLNSASPPSDKEEDLLDCSGNLTATSRLGCQIRVDASFEGKEIQISSDAER